MNSRVATHMAMPRDDRRPSAIGDFFQLMGEGTATYLSYWTLFFALQRAFSGRRRDTKGH